MNFGWNDLSVSPWAVYFEVKVQRGAGLAVTRTTSPRPTLKNPSNFHEPASRQGTS